MNYRSSNRSVFISATTKGFADWRLKIFKILAAQKIQAREQSLLTPEREVIRAEIEQQIAASHGVICLVGPYYGYPLEAAGTDGTPPLSYSQYEWMLATKFNKPRIVYLIEDSFFQPEEIVPEESENIPRSAHFHQWQRTFYETIRAMKDTHPQRRITSPLDLAIALAMINWSDWPHE